MIEFFRKLSHSFGAKIFFGFLALCFVFLWGGQDGLKMLNMANDTTIAKVGSKKIKTADFYTELERMAIQIQLNSKQTIDPQAFRDERLYNQLLQQIILNDLVDQEANQLKIAVSNDFVTAQIKSQDVFKDQSKLFSKERFLKIIERLGYKQENDYIERFKSDVQKERIVDALSVTVSLPDFYQDILYGWDQEIRNIEGIIIDVSKIDLPTVPTADEMRTFYGENRKLFYAQEARTFDALIIDHEKFDYDIVVAPLEIDQEYQQYKDSTYKDLDQKGAVNLIQKKILNVKRQEKLVSLSKLIEQAYDDGKSLRDIADKYNLKIVHFKAEQRRTDNEEVTENKHLTDTKELITESFSQEENTLSYLYNLKNGSQSAYIIVSKITPAHPLNLKDAYPEIKKKIILERQFKLAQGLAENMRRDIIKGQPMISLANNKESKFFSSTVTRTGQTSPTIINFTPEMLSAIFNIDDKNITLLPVVNQGNVDLVIVKIVQIKTPTLDSAKSDAKANFFSAVSHQFSNDLMLSYINALKEKYPTTLNEKLLNKILAPTEQR